jgi:multidrug resistance efflux pump
VAKGELLLEIDPAPYQYTVNQVSAQLHAAEENVRQSQAGVEAAKANVAKSDAAIGQAQASVNVAKAAVAEAEAGVKKSAAAVDLARAELAIVVNVQKASAGAVSKQKLEQEQQNVKEQEAALAQAEAGVVQARATEVQAEAALVQAQAAARQAEAALRQSEFAVQVATSNVAAVRAELEGARFNLAQCRVKAPADGYVVDWQVQEGTMIVPTPMAAAGTFIETGDTAVVAVFPQNYLSYVRPGNEVELVLDPYPGRLFQGAVDTVIEATGEGQFAPGGTIPPGRHHWFPGDAGREDSLARGHAGAKGSPGRRWHGDDLHRPRQARSHHLQGRDPDEEMAPLRAAGLIARPAAQVPDRVGSRTGGRNCPGRSPRHARDRRNARTAASCSTSHRTLRRRSRTRTGTGQYSSSGLTDRPPAVRVSARPARSAPCTAAAMDRVRPSLRSPSASTCSTRCRE